MQGFYSLTGLLLESCALGFFSGERREVCSTRKVVVTPSSSSWWRDMYMNSNDRHSCQSIYHLIVFSIYSSLQRLQARIWHCRHSKMNRGRRWWHFASHARVSHQRWTDSLGIGGPFGIESSEHLSDLVQMFELQHEREVSQHYVCALARFNGRLVEDGC